MRTEDKNDFVYRVGKHNEILSKAIEDFLIEHDIEKIISLLFGAMVEGSDYLNEAHQINFLKERRRQLTEQLLANRAFNAGAQTVDAVELDDGSKRSELILENAGF